MAAKRNEHFKSLQGSLMIARIVDGKRTTIRELGNQTSVELSVSTESTTIKETKTGKRADAKILTTGRTVELSATTNELVPADVALAFGAELIAKGSNTVVDEVIATALAGESIKLNGVNVSALTITDSTGVPGTLIEGTNYTLDADYGVVTFKDLASFTGPYKASYAEGAITVSEFFSMPDNAEYYVFFKGVDAFGGDPMSFELYRYSPKTDNSMQFINEEVGELTFGGTALIVQDQVQSDGSLLDGYGRIINIIKTTTP